MKNKIIRIFFFAALVVGAFVFSASAQIAGGYADADVKDKDVRRAARIAAGSQTKRVGHKISFLSITKAEVQVVAGLNYRICMRVRDGKRVRTVTAVVYKDLKNWYSLTDWKAGGCSEL